MALPRLAGPRWGCDPRSMVDGGQRRRVAMTSPSLVPIKQPDLSDEVYQRLLQAILSGEIAPGERLVERQLADKLGVSRAPVRDALVRLQRDGVVEPAGRRGKVVAALSAQDAWEVYVLRSALEGMAARIAATRADAADIAALEAIVLEMREQLRRYDLRALAALDQRFHEAVCRASRNGRLLKSWTAMAEQIRLLLQVDAQVVDAQYGELSRMPDRHAELAQAIRGGDPDAAERAVRSHIDAVAQRVVSVLRKAEQPPAAGSGLGIPKPAVWPAVQGPESASRSVPDGADPGPQQAVTRRAAG
jgi:DNA-binding GntR family transcriptional regulator